MLLFICNIHNRNKIFNYIFWFEILAQRNNWPPLPDKFCFQPCFYQDIEVEIPLEFQKVVNMLYYIWMCKMNNSDLYYFSSIYISLVIVIYFFSYNLPDSFNWFFSCFFFAVHTLMYLLNVIGCLALFIQQGRVAMFGMSILYCVLFTPASYLCWFRPVYKAFRLVLTFQPYISIDFFIYSIIEG